MPACDSHSPTVSDCFLSFDPSICSTVALPPLENSDHVAVSVSLDFLSNSKIDAPSQCTAYDYSHADWGGLHDHLRDAPWEDIFKLGALNSVAAALFYFVSESRLALMCISLIVNIRSRLSCLCCCHIS